MLPLKVFSEQPVSEILASLVCDSISPVVKCEHCGRIHYDSSGEFMGKGELVRLEKQAKKNPQTYVKNDGGIHWGVIWANRTVINCPCNFLGWLEGHIWRDRKLISGYLLEKSTAVLEEAKRTHEDASKAALVE